jgi:pimeloyl-ACP methyl ester carboxylesterase
MLARIAGVEIAYEAAGDGPPVLFFHAFPLGLFMWEAQVQALQATHRVVRFDARGLGASPVDDGLLTMERIADDGASLLGHLGVDRAVVAGCSMGGYAAFAMVRRHPGRVRALVLQDTRAGADTEEGRSHRAVLAEKTLKAGATAARDAFLPKLLGATTKAERPEIVARIERAILATAPRGIANALYGLGARADSAPTLAEIRVPTLVVCGEEDVITPVAESEAIHRGIAGSRLAVIPRAGHLANIENPTAYNAALLDFLTGLERRG